MTAPSTFPSVLRELLRTHQAFLSYAATHIHKLDLTLPQFDVIITLGNTPGIPFKTLGEKTLITKGTLTGVIKRLEDKGFVQRFASEKDGRSQLIRLTAEGKILFERTYPEHLLYIERLFKDYLPEDIAALEAALKRLRETVAAARSDEGEPGDEEMGE